MSWPIADLKGMDLPDGFILEEDGLDFLRLLFDGKKVQTFASFGSTPDEKREEIRQAAEAHLRKLRGRFAGP